MHKLCLKIVKKYVEKVKKLFRINIFVKLFIKRINYMMKSTFNNFSLY